jgi:small subunit ribosomal protein S7
MRLKYSHEKALYWVPSDHIGQVSVFQKLVHGLMKHGKKQKAFVLLSKAILTAQQKLESQTDKQLPSTARSSVLGFEFVAQAIENVRPSVEVRSKKIAGISREIPCLVPTGRGQGLAIRWIIESARSRKKTGSRGFADNLADELLDAYLHRGTPRQKRDNLHKTATTNRAYLRYRWW